MPSPIRGLGQLAEASHAKAHLCGVLAVFMGQPYSGERLQLRERFLRWDAFIPRDAYLFAFGSPTGAADIGHG